VPSVVSAQSCREQFIPNSSAADFEDHGDGTLTDRRSGLTWSRCSAGQVWRGNTCAEPAAEFDWDAAETFVRGVNDRGDLFYADWRVPNLRELASISEVNCREPRINLEAFPATAEGFYWTSSRKLIEGPEWVAFTLSFGAVGMGVSRLAERHYLRLVRRAERTAGASPVQFGL
jgi:hypothetical protein